MKRIGDVHSYCVFIPRRSMLLLRSNEGALGANKRKFLPKIYGQVHDGDNFHTLKNKELNDLLNDNDIARRYNIQRLRRLGQIVRMERGECSMRN